MLAPLSGLQCQSFPKAHLCREEGQQMRLQQMGKDCTQPTKWAYIEDLSFLDDRLLFAFLQEGGHELQGEVF